MIATLPPGVGVSARIAPEHAEILTADALVFVAELHRAFEPMRKKLLAQRVTRQTEFDAGRKPDFLAETKPIRESTWTIAALPADLQRRRVEITGPALFERITTSDEFVEFLTLPAYEMIDWRLAWTHATCRQS